MKTKNLKINKNFVPVFSTQDFLQYELLKNKVHSVIKDDSLIREEHHDNWKNLTIYVSSDNYDKVINSVLEHLDINDRNRDVFWYSKDMQAIPCGYMRLAYIYTDLPKGVKLETTLSQFRDSLTHVRGLGKDIQLNYSYDYNAYGIDVRNDNSFEKMSDALSFHFVLSGIYPFYDLDYTDDKGSLVKKIKEF